MLGQTVAQLCFDFLSRLPIVVEPKEVSVSSDSGFAMPWMFAGCERLQLTYTFGLAADAVPGRNLEKRTPGHRQGGVQ